MNQLDLGSQSRGLVGFTWKNIPEEIKNNNEKVFIFNGWTFASDPNLSPFDHAIYDLQLLNCYKV